MDRPRRSHAQARAEMRAGILRLGNEQLAEVGAAALSVREIARGLGVASSAIYRHVANRDELLTLLLVDAYEDLAAAALDGARQGRAGDQGAEPAAEDAPARRFAEIARGMREWAVANSARWALAYGSPVPGYAAPAELTNDPGTRVMTEFLRVLAGGSASSASEVAAGSAAETSPGAPPLSPELRALLVAGTAEVGVEASPERAEAALGAWSDLIGRINAEVFEQFGPAFAAHGTELFDRWVAATAHRFGLTQ